MMEEATDIEAIKAIMHHFILKVRDYLLSVDFHLKLC